jgi:hypothetical protein
MRSVSLKGTLPQNPERERLERLARNVGRRARAQMALRRQWQVVAPSSDGGQ